MESFREFIQQFKKNKAAVVGAWIVLLLVVCAIFAPLLAPHDPYVQNAQDRLLKPIWEHGGNAKYLLGTDDLGRDILSRLIYGARISLTIGICFYGDCGLFWHDIRAHSGVFWGENRCNYHAYHGHHVRFALYFIDRDCGRCVRAFTH